MARARKASGAKDDKTGKAKKSQSSKKQPAKRAASASKSSAGSKGAGSGNKSTKRGVKSGTSRSKKSPPKKPAKKKAVTKSTSKATSGASSSSGGSGNKKKSASGRTNASKKASSSTSKTSSTAKSGSKTTKSTSTKSPFPAKFLKEMQELLATERETYERQAAQLRAEAQSLVEDLDPGDVQFDEESGEGDTIAVERNRDLALASKAQEMIGEIDHALAKFDDGIYGICEISGEPIPKERLEAIPWAREKVEYKVGGFGRR